MKKWTQKKSWWVVVTCMLLSLCSCRASKVMTYSQFQEVPVGENVVQIQSTIGRPYEIRKREDGLQEYVYIERIPLGTKQELFREYLFVVQEDGKIVDKKITEDRTQEVQFHLY